MSVIEIDGASASCKTLQIMDHLADGAVVIIRNLHAIHEFRKQLISYS